MSSLESHDVDEKVDPLDAVMIEVESHDEDSGVMLSLTRSELDAAADHDGVSRRYCRGYLEDLAWQED